MDNGIEIKREVINLLQTLPVCKPSTNMKNWTVRCPYCGDSKTANHGHFSILIDLDSDRPMLYRCFRCNESGILTDMTLEDLQLFAPANIRNGISQYNKKSHNSTYITDKPKNYKIPEVRYNQFTQRKLDYINNRLGTDIDAMKATQYKIILNFIDFLVYNNIPFGNEGNSILKAGTVRELEQNYVGFLSSNNNKITFRDITENGFFGRYYKVTLDIMNTSPNTFYALDSSYDLLYTNDMHIRVAEGTFDIIGIYENLDIDKSQNSLFLASCGFGFSRILKFLIYKGCTSDIHFHLYADADKSDAEIRNLFRNQFYKIWIDKIIIHRNTIPGQKDFGVRKDEMRDYSYLLK